MREPRWTAGAACLLLALACAAGTASLATAALVEAPGPGALRTLAPGTGEPGASASATDAGTTAPVCSATFKDGAASVRHGRPIAGRLTCADAGGDPLTFAVVKGPGHGTLSALEPVADAPGSAGFTYTPAPAYTGPDGFELAASDGTASSGPVPLSITVTNAAPSCTASLDAPGRVKRGTTVPGRIVCTDADDDPLSFRVTKAPAHGTVTAPVPVPGSPTAATFTFSTPSTYGSGVETVAFKANDTVADSAAATLSIVVGNAPNVAPVCAAELDGGVSRVAEGKTVTGRVVCRDTQDDSILSVSVAKAPGHGRLSDLKPATADDEHSAVRTFTYTADRDYAGPDRFTFTALDGEQAPAPPAPVELEVFIPPNVAPVCTAALDGGVTEVDQGDAVSGRMQCTDADGQALTFAVAAQPAHGQVSAPRSTGKAGEATFRYTAGRDYAGPDSFALKASDGKLDSAPARIDVTVDDDPDAAPVCTATLDGGVTEVAHGAAVGGVLECSDEEGAPLVLRVASPPDHGTLSPLTRAGGPGRATFTYTPEAGYAGPDRFSLMGDDGAQSSAPAVVRLTVLPGPAPAPGPASGGGSTGGGGGGADPAVPNPKPPVKPPGGGGPVGPAAVLDPCARYTGTDLSQCRLGRRLARQCGPLKGRRRADCITRGLALENCRRISTWTAKGKRRHAACVRKARAKAPARKRAARTRD